MSTELSLYQIEENLVALLDSEDMVESDEQHLEILREIAQATDAAVVKRDNCIRFHRHLSIQQDAIDAEIKRLQDLKGHYAHAQEKLESYVIRIMDELVEQPKRGAKKLEGRIGVMTLKQNPPAVEISDEHAVPSRYKDVTVTMDADAWLTLAPEPLVQAARRTDYRVKRTEVKDALKSGEDVPGADLGFGKLRLEVR